MTYQANDEFAQLVALGNLFKGEREVSVAGDFSALDNSDDVSTEAVIWA